MSSWLALLLAPALAIISLSLLYAWAMPVCGIPGVTLPPALMQAVPLAALLVNLFIALHAWRQWRRMTHTARQQEESNSKAPLAPPTTVNVVAYLGVWSGVLFSLLVLLLWIVARIFSPCL